MDTQNFITTFDISKLQFHGTHSAAPVITFYRPCIGYLLKGRGDFLYQGNNFSAEEGDLIYIADETKYYSVWTGYPEVEFYSMNFSFNNKLAYLDYRFQILKNYPRDIFDKIYQNREKNFLTAMSGVYELLSDIYIKMDKSPYTPMNSKIKPAITYMEEHYTEEINIAFLSKLCNYSEPHFYAIFREITGVTPITYKHNILMQHALKFLSETDYSIEQISTMLGFSSANYFRKVFYKTFGKTPKEIR